MDALPNLGFLVVWLAPFSWVTFSFAARVAREAVLSSLLLDGLLSSSGSVTFFGFLVLDGSLKKFGFLFESGSLWSSGLLEQNGSLLKSGVLKLARSHCMGF